MKYIIISLRQDENNLTPIYINNQYYDSSLFTDNINDAGIFDSTVSARDYLHSRRLKTNEYIVAPIKIETKIKVLL